MRTPADLQKATLGEVLEAYRVETAILTEMMIRTAFSPHDPANHLAVAYSESEAATLLIELVTRGAATRLDLIVRAPNRA